MVDGGSTHNFLQSRIVSLLNLQVSTRRPFDVMVGNGDVLKCEGLCAAVPVQVQKHVFLVDFYILHIQGADVVFGVQWLQLLRPIMVDYQRLTMNFNWEGEHIQLQGDKQLSQQVSMNQFRKLQHVGDIASMFHITMLPTHTSGCHQTI